jgi:TRAP-type mannitol/chloroaromatic compound transport system substrate-binding protein
MKGKRMILVISVLCVLSMVVFPLLSSQGAWAKGKYKLKFQASWPSGSTLFGNFKQFCERVKVLSAGRLEIEPLPAGAVVGALEVLDATSRRVIDGAHTWASYWFGKDMTAVLFTGGPGGTFGMDLYDYLGWIYEGGGLQLYNEFYQKVLKLKVVPFPILRAAPQSFMWFKEPIKSWEDLKGKKCRIGGMAGQVFQRAGMSVVMIPGGEILPAAERGVIDCAEWVTPGEDMKMGFHDVWKYYYLPGVHENTSVGELLINQDLWNELPDDLKAIIEAACLETYIRWGVWFDYYNSKALKELKEKYGVHVMETPKDILVKFLQTWDEIAAEEAAKNPFFKKVLESQKKFASIVVPGRRRMWPPYSFIANYYWPEK